MLPCQNLPLLHQAILRYDGPEVESLTLHEGSEALMAEGGEFASPLHAALIALRSAGDATERAMAILKLVLDRARALGVLNEIINLADRNWKTPLDLGLETGRDSVSLLLLDCGADPELGYSKRALPLFRAIDSQMRAVVRAFCVKHPRLLTQQYKGQGPLAYCLQQKHCHLAIDIFCLDRGIQDQAVADGLITGNKDSALIMAGHLTHPDRLLQFMKIMIAADCETSLAAIIPALFHAPHGDLLLKIAPQLYCLAARAGSLPLLKALSGCGIAASAVAQSGGETIHPLDLAILHGEEEAAHWLLDHGADIAPPSDVHHWLDLAPDHALPALGNAAKRGMKALFERLLQGRKLSPATILTLLPDCRDLIFKTDDAALLKTLLDCANAPLIIDDLLLYKLVRTAPYACLTTLAQANAIRQRPFTSPGRARYIEELATALADRTLSENFTGVTEAFQPFTPLLALLALTDLDSGQEDHAIHSILPDPDLFRRWPVLTHLLAAIGALPHAVLDHLLNGLKGNGDTRLAAHAAITGLVDFIDLVNECRLQSIASKAIAELPNVQQIISHLRKAAAMDSLDEESRKLIEICLVMLEKLITNGHMLPSASLLDQSLLHLARSPGMEREDQRPMIESVMPYDFFLLLHGCYRPGPEGHLRPALIRYYLRKMEKA